MNLIEKKKKSLKMNRVSVSSGTTAKSRLYMELVSLNGGREKAFKTMAKIFPNLMKAIKPRSKKHKCKKHELNYIKTASSNCTNPDFVQNQFPERKS